MKHVSYSLLLKLTIPISTKHRNPEIEIILKPGDCYETRTYKVPKYLKEEAKDEGNQV